MANVSLDVGLNKTVSPQHRQTEESQDDQKFMAIMAQANEQEQGQGQEKKTSTDNEGSKEVLRGFFTTKNEESSEEQQVNSVDNPNHIGPDERLKLDDSHLPKPKNGPDVILQVEKSVGEQNQSKSTSPDSLLSQITASNNQKTDVEHHLGALPKSMQEHAGKVEIIAPDIIAKETKKGPIDLIGPIVKQGEEPQVETDSVKVSDKSGLEENQTAKTKHTQVEAFKATDPGPRYSEGPIIDSKAPSDAIVSQTNNDQLERSRNFNSKVEAFDGEIKPREWFLHNKNAASQEVTAQQQADVKATQVPQSEEKPIVAPSVKSESTEHLTQPVKQPKVGPQAETTQLAADIKKALLQAREPISTSNSTQQADELPVAVNTDKSTEASVTQRIPTDMSNKSMSDLKAMVEQLTPQEKKHLEVTLKESINSDKAADPQVKRIESTLYEMVTGKPAREASKGEVGAAQTQNVAVVEQKPDKVAENPSKLDSLVSDAKTPQTAKPEVTYNSTKVVSAKETTTAEAPKQNVEVAPSDESQEMTSDTDSEQSQNSGSNQRQTASANVENIFKAIRTLGTEQIQSKEEFEQVIHQVEQSRQSQQTVQQQATAQAKLQADPAVTQALNLARNDAAKMLQDKVNMMINLNNKEAEIRLDPAELGSMQIRIRSDAEQAQINFVVQNQQAKELLEESMPKLREMLEEQGIELGESNIQQQSEGNGDNEGNEQNGHGKLANEGSEAQNNKEQSVTSRKQSDSAIDYYA
ncbi:flagellar hook-length control protein FliK [Pseudoalteromonas obscura]|uniref:Flagellar hook-length control protein FliK n=1 Tax=Pseudoalteromonas obscura TaxID=3048491 RepID=A0ABT7ETT6_9GAMM|nr:flagellar hook-length control protein FliK [Pseudoalteromonas sp. P94(2023)]MDK2598464.1 flagellar hook-length control protein FliK [Pseudoalteromonas sp. P94(2023)]